MYVKESYISCSNGSIIGGGVVDNKDHRKNIKKNIIKNCKAISYKNLLRRPEKYVDKLVKVSGKILQIAEEDDTETEFLLTDDDGNTYYVNYKFPKSNYRLLEDDSLLYQIINFSINKSPRAPPPGLLFINTTLYAAISQIKQTYYSLPSVLLSAT